MIRTNRTIAAIVVVLAATAAGAFGQLGPKSPPPISARAIFQNRQLYVLFTAFVPILETRTREVEVDGRTETQAYTVCRYKTEQKQSQFGAEQFRVMTVGGPSV